MQKPYRFLLGRVATYAEEGSAYLRRRRIRSMPFVRVWSRGGAAEAVDLRGEPGARMSAAAAALIEDVEPPA